MPCLLVNSYEEAVVYYMFGLKKLISEGRGSFTSPHKRTHRGGGITCFRSTQSPKMLKPQNFFCLLPW